jgi:hypothetical protein
VTVTALAVVLALAMQQSGFVQQSTLDGRPVFVLSNDKLQLTLNVRGGAMVELLLRDDPDKLNPYGNPDRVGPQTGQRPRVLGHFVCVDGFGPASNEERAAGLPTHGEAQALPWELLASGKQDRVSSATFKVTLPIVQETFRRSFQMVDGENVIYVDSELESLLGFDRPVNWGEHVTIGAPFLEPVKTVVDMSGRRAKTRVHPVPNTNPLPRRLASSQEFTWPMAPKVAGSATDLRAAPENPGSIDHATTLMDPERKLAFVTALNPARGYLLGYVFRREEFPWLQDWENYQPNLRMSRGLEFATQPFDVPRRETITLNSMFGAPVYRWLPAKSKITARFLLFWVKAPAGMTKVDEVRVEGGQIVLEDRAAGKRVQLAASLPL